MKSKILSYLGIGLLLIALAGVRFFETNLFYDPLIPYFKGPFTQRPVPELNEVKWFTSTFFRYILNSLLSIGVLWLMYKNTHFIKASLWVYSLAFIVISAMILFFIDATTETDKMILFYLRRFLIQPILLFVLVPGFYFLKQKATL